VSARLAAAWPRIDPILFATYAGACVLYAAVAFYGSMHRQTGGVWSAPLDDVFIHFDYARATARGYPFQWSEGNGYSSPRLVALQRDGERFPSGRVGPLGHGLPRARRSC
jgi:hypothetical protein